MTRRRLLSEGTGFPANRTLVAQIFISAGTPSSNSFRARPAEIREEAFMSRGSLTKRVVVAFVAGPLLATAIAMGGAMPVQAAAANPTLGTLDPAAPGDRDRDLHDPSRLLRLARFLPAGHHRPLDQLWLLQLRRRHPYERNHHRSDPGHRRDARWRERGPGPGPRRRRPRPPGRGPDRHLRQQLQRRRLWRP